jgi:hypothetical protein
MELGGFCHGCDLLMVKNGLEEMQKKLGRSG